MNHTHLHRATELPFWQSKTGIALIMLAVIGTFHTAREHHRHLSKGRRTLIRLL